MSEDEYRIQQDKYKFLSVDPSILASVIDDRNGSGDMEDDEETKRLKQELREKLWKMVEKKISKVCTVRQREAINLFLKSKKQEHMGEILGISQEAANVRIKLGLERLTKSCNEDQEIIEIFKKLHTL